jgi:hypothetical protein
MIDRLPVMELLLALAVQLQPTGHQGVTVDQDVCPEAPSSRASMMSAISSGSSMPQRA